MEQIDDEYNPQFVNTDTGKDNLIKIASKQVAKRIRTFDHFIFLWGHQSNYYVPPKHVLTWHFISQVLSGEKLLLRNDQIGTAINMPKMKGVRIREIWDHLKNKNDLKSYFPDFPATDCIPRDYFFNARLLGTQGNQQKCL